MLRLGVIGSAVVATIMAFVPPALAVERYFLTGYDISVFCGPTGHPSDLAACAALIGAAADAANSPPGVMGYKSCLPATATIEQIRLLILDMLTRRPDWLPWAAFRIVGAVTSAAYPCGLPTTLGAADEPPACPAHEVHSV